jgi:hypothetical protein
VVKFVKPDPQSITAYKSGFIGEQKLAASLAGLVGESLLLLNDRKVPGTRGNIDHLVVSRSGIWIVDAKNYSGVVQKRDVGGMFKTDVRLYVGGRDRSSVIEGMGWQVEAVVKALAGRQVPLFSAVCFTDAEWGWFTKPFILKDVLVTGTNTLAKSVMQDGPLTPDLIRLIAGLLSTALPPK